MAEIVQLQQPHQKKSEYKCEIYEANYLPEEGKGEAGIIKDNKGDQGRLHDRDKN
jgi:hypothetical protein